LIGVTVIGMELRKEMGLTHADFFRMLAQLPGGWLQETRADGASLKFADGRIEIRLGPEQRRHLSALVRIPATEVLFRYENLSEAEQENFQARFDLTYQRGGG